MALSDSLQRQLNLYALAAGAAGVGALALAQPAEAKIVYTKVQQYIGANGNYAMDLNHDGVVDFLIQQWPGSVGPDFGALYAKAALGNAIQSGAAVLQPGQQIGPSQGFVSSIGGYGQNMVWAERSSQTFLAGPWVNVVDRYLGLKFQIQGKTHYGWARLTVKVTGFKGCCGVTAVLTGYAYETIAGKGVKAGDIGNGPTNTHETTNELKSGDSSNLTSLPGDSDFLGMLASGAGALPFWRRP